MGCYDVGLESRSVVFFLNDSIGDGDSNSPLSDEYGLTVGFLYDFQRYISVVDESILLMEEVVSSSGFHKRLLLLIFAYGCNGTSELVLDLVHFGILFIIRMSSFF